MIARIDGICTGRARLHVGGPWGYPARFNAPRPSRHLISTRRWLRCISCGGRWKWRSS